MYSNTEGFLNRQFTTSSIFDNNFHMEKVEILAQNILLYL